MRRTIVIVRKKIAKGTEKLTQAPRGPMVKVFYSMNYL